MSNKYIYLQLVSGLSEQYRISTWLGLVVMYLGGLIIKVALREKILKMIPYFSNSVL